jgi:hypothetical protein
MTTSIATSFNQMFTGISFQMMTPDMQARFGTITTNISAMFDRMVPAVTAFNSAFMKIAETGSGFLPGLADSLANVMNKFDAFITRAQNDGSLQNFMSKGIEAFKGVSKFLLDFGQDIYEVFGNKSPEEFMDTLKSLKDFVVGLFEVFRGLAAVLDTIAPPINAVVDAVGGWENAILGLLGVFTVFKALSAVKFLKDMAGAFSLFGSAAATAGAAGAAGMAGVAAGAQKGVASTTGVFAGAGTTAAGKYGGALKMGLKALPWVGLGVGIAEAIQQGLRDGAGGWRDDLADLLVGPTAEEHQRQADALSLERFGFVIGPDGRPLAPPDPRAPESRRRPFDDRNPYRDRQLRGVDARGQRVRTDDP